MHLNFFKHQLIYRVLVLLVTIISHSVSIGQVSVKGPECVLPKVEYQYLVEGQSEATAKVNICIQGGIFSASKNSCYEGKEISVVYVIWDEKVTEGTINVKSDKGSTWKKVSITKPLLGGLIDSTKKEKVVPYNTKPNPIPCSKATGGSCSPAYSYQWQQSADKLRWVDIAGATGEHLIMSTPLTQTTFYRRQVTENTSTTVAYSNAVGRYVSPPASKKN